VIEDYKRIGFDFQNITPHKMLCSGKIHEHVYKTTDYARECLNLTELTSGQIDTPRSKDTEILGSAKPLNLDFLRSLNQRWGSPQVSS